MLSEKNMAFTGSTFHENSRSQYLCGQLYRVLATSDEKFKYMAKFHLQH